jgi:hypothetical protein
MSAAQSQQPSTQETDEGPTISHDECFDLLSNHRRRYTLHYLQQNSSSAGLGTLAEQIAAWENETTVEDLSYDQRKRVYTSLQQVHLPRMHEAGVVEFDDREGFVEIGPAAENLDIYLEVVQKREIPWSFFYLGIGGINTAVVAAHVMSVWPVAVIPDVGLSAFVLTTFLLTSLAHLYVTRTKMRLGQSEEPPSLTD